MAAQHPHQRQNGQDPAEREAERDARRTALQAGAQEASQLQMGGQREILDKVTEPDVDRDLPDGHPDKLDLEQWMAAEFSQQIMLGNITRREYEREKWMDKAKSALSRMERAEPGGIGSKCVGRTRERLTGGYLSGAPEDMAWIDSDVEREIDAAFEARTAQRSGSVGGIVLKRILEAYVVTRQEGVGDEDGDSGLLSRITGGLF